MHLTQEEESAIKAIIDEFEKDEQPTRERQIRLWKKLEFYWAGITKIYWDETAHDWRVYDYETETTGDTYYDKQLNVFRAYLESIIAALSSTVPSIKCSPDDADNISDVLTARGGTKIAQLVYDHIDAPLLWVRALFVYCTQGMIAAYNYTDVNEKYGTVEIPKEEDSEEEVEVKVCPVCKMELQGPDLDAAYTIMQMESDEFDPGQDDVVIDNFINKDQILCPQCAILVDPEIAKNKIIVTRITGKTKQPKARQCIEINGGLYVKVPNYARCQADIPYLAYEYETHYSNVYKKYPKLRGKFTKGDVRYTSSTSGNEMYERWGRISPQYRGQMPTQTPTVRNWWLRPSAFECCADEDICKSLRRKFPLGCKSVWINDEHAETIPEVLDDHWTLTFNPLSEYIHFDPLGQLLTSVQEINDELVSLTLQTIEHGIPQTFADPKVLNFDAYRNTEAIPGAIYPAKAPGGKTLQEGFHTIQTATLSQEVGPFGDKIQELGQFVSGAMPGIYGGQQETGSRTAAQYSMMTQRSLQRLQNSWKMLNYWWKNTFSKVIPAYIKDMLEDERIVQAQGKENFVNIVIEKAKMDGKIGQITVESSENLPYTFGQVRDALMELFKMGNPEVLAALAAPENLGVLQNYMGLEDFHMPGESDREKQYEEINILLQGPPMPGPGGMELPSIMPDFEIDNHPIEAEISRNWLVGEAGRQAKINNPDGYKNVLLHLKAHMMMAQQMAMMMAPQQPNQQEAK